MSLLSQSELREQMVPITHYPWPIDGHPEDKRAMHADMLRFKRNGTKFQLEITKEPGCKERKIIVLWRTKRGLLTGDAGNKKANSRHKSVMPQVRKEGI